MLSILPCALGHLYVSFGEMPVQVFCPFFIRLFAFLRLSCVSCLFWKSIPYQRHHLQIFPPVSQVIMLFFYGFLCSAKTFKFYQDPFVYFCFCFHCLQDTHPQKCCSDLCQRMSPYVSLQNFYGMQAYSQVLIHFEFIFVCGVRECSNFIVLPVGVQFFQHHLFKTQYTVFCALYNLAFFVLD